MNDQIKKEDRLPIETMTETYARFAQGIFDVVRVIQQELRTIAPKVVPYLEKAANIDWAAVMQRLDQLPKKSKDAMRLALAEGWFFGWYDGLQSLMELVESFETTHSSPVDVDHIMVAYYRNALQPFTDELISKYPDRARAIKAAVNAHISLADDGYFLSVPVFIAQADGLLAKITGVESPMTKAAMTKTAKEFREKYADDPELLDLLYPLLELEGSDFVMSAKARNEAVQATGRSFTALNRHQVMHGERSDYGTEINSLKAFSFLVFAGLHIPTVLVHSRT
jgi:hypothetical protein